MNEPSPGCSELEVCSNETIPAPPRRPFAFDPSASAMERREEPAASRQKLLPCYRMAQRRLNGILKSLDQARLEAVIEADPTAGARVLTAFARLVDAAARLQQVHGQLGTEPAPAGPPGTIPGSVLREIERQLWLL